MQTPNEAKTDGIAVSSNRVITTKTSVRISNSRSFKNSSRLTPATTTAVVRGRSGGVSSGRRNDLWIGLLSLVVFQCLFAYWWYNSMALSAVASAVAGVQHPQQSTQQQQQQQKPEIPFNQTLYDASVAALSRDRMVTLEKLQSIGVTEKHLFRSTNGNITSLPAWSTIVDNYGEEPVVLGLERCEEYRQISKNHRAVAPAGLFSSGTNVFVDLIVGNCHPPQQQRKKFHLWQVPWGKHNPASARGRHTVKNYERWNVSTILPVVMVRHPYSWVYAICQHPYALHWPHGRDICHETLQLNRRVAAKLGSGVEHYMSLIDVWKEWNRPFMFDAPFPAVIVRLEDLIVRPEPVIRKICDCVGGRMGPKFKYKVDPAIDGPGHGSHTNSDLVASWIKTGRPLERYRDKYSKNDWKIIDETLKTDYGMMEALQYKQT